MSVFLIIVGILMLLVVIGLVVFMFWEKNREVEYVGDTIVRNFLPEYAENNYKGVLVSEERIGDRTRITFKPKPRIERDFEGNILPIGEDKRKPVSVIVLNNLVKRFPKGTLSDEPEIMLIPPNMDNFPKDFQQTFFGNIILKAINEEDSYNTALEVMESKIDLTNKLLKKTEGGDIVRDYIQLDDELKKEHAKKVLDLMGSKRDNLGTSGSYRDFPSGGS